MLIGLSNRPTPPLPPALQALDGGELRFTLDKQDGREIPFDQIAQVSVSLSDSWHERGINLHLKSGDTVRVVTDDVVYPMEELESSPDLVVMVMTEWLVKTAGGLALQLARTGFPTPLVLPKLLTEDGNAAVRNRNQRWKEYAASRQQ